MSCLWVRETYVNETEGYQYGDSEWYETYHEDLGALYRALRSQYGGKVSNIYRDNPTGPPVKVGWVFTKRDRYEDTRETYTRAVWVEVSTVPVEKVTTYTPSVSPWDSAKAKAKARLEYLRGEIRAERISYGEIAELQNLVPYIEKGDVELLEWAGEKEPVL